MADPPTRDQVIANAALIKAEICRDIAARAARTAS